jgi:hypothetical protein
MIGRGWIARSALGAGERAWMGVNVWRRKSAEGGEDAPCYLVSSIHHTNTLRPSCLSCEI